MLVAAEVRRRATRQDKLAHVHAQAAGELPERRHGGMVRVALEAGDGDDRSCSSSDTLDIPMGIGT